MAAFDLSFVGMLSVAVVVFLLPGWIAASWLRAPARFSAAVILSTLSLFWSLMLTLAMGLQIDFVVLFGFEVLLSAFLFGAMIRHVGGWREASAGLRPHLSKMSLSLPSKMLIPAGLAALVFMIFLLRLWVDPLSGFDAPVRWNLLARKMLELKTLNFYPPISSADFKVYTYPDSMAPIISTVYWWFYAAVGGVYRRLTGLFVIAQALVILSLVYRITDRMAGPRSALLAVLALASAPLAFSSIYIGQETGLTTITILGLVYYLSPDEEGSPDDGSVVMAGCALAVGALAREYGWAFLVLGWLVLIKRKANFRSIVLLTGVVLALAIPWYLRTWVLTGNPLYPMPFGKLFPFNPVYALRLADYARHWGVTQYSTGDWASLILELLSRAPLQFIAVGFCFRRHLRFLVVSVILVCLLWLASIGLTFGGRSYSMRVLAPAVALLSIVFAWGIARLRIRRMSWVMPLLMTLLLLRSLSFDLNFPMRPRLQEPVTWLGQPLVASNPGYRRPELQEIVGALFPPGVSLLSFDPYAHVALMGSPNPAVMVWSPEVSFLFDLHLTGEEMRRRLLRMGIGGLQYRSPGEHEPVLEISPFFRDDRENWVELAELDPNSVLYALPP